MIIDIHMHLGDFLYRNGASMIGNDIPFPKRFTIQSFEEKVLRFNSNAATRWFFAKYDDLYTESVKNRIHAATFAHLQEYFDLLSNSSSKLFGDSIVESYCMPIAPYVTYSDIREWAKSEKRLKTFTSINPDLSIEESTKEIASAANDPNCYGIKLHPIIQGIPFNSERCYSAIEAFRKSGKPILFHAGASRYYLGKEKKCQHCELDDVKSASEMVSRYPDVPFIIGHAGIAEYNEWAQEFRLFNNVFFDITVQPCKTIQELVSIYGEDRALFATDWPCVNPGITMKIVRKALSSSQLEKVMFKNAKSILRA